LQTVAKTAGMLHDDWVENADRWVAGFLEKFEEGCHSMVSNCPTFVDNLNFSPLQKLLHFNPFWLFTRGQLSRNESRSA